MKPAAQLSPRVDLRKYLGQWVALDPASHEVVGHGPTAESAKREAIEKGIQRPLLSAVPASDAYFVGGTA